MRKVLLNTSLIFCGTGAATVFFFQLQQEEKKFYPVKISRGAKAICKHGLPGHENVLSSPAFVTSVNYRTRIPNWVAEHITRETVEKKNLERSQGGDFYEDPQVPAPFRASNSDYWDSGWSRGHMAPVSCHYDSLDSLKSTFSLSNMVPQDLSQNGCDWARLEHFVRGLVFKGYSDVYVVSGPLWIADASVPLPSDAKGRPVPWQMMQFPVIGKNELWVPTHLFKAVVAEDSSDKLPPTIGAFIMPNRPIGEFQSLQHYETTLEFIERKSGLRLFPKLETSRTVDLCQKANCSKANENGLQQYWRYYGHLQLSKSLPELERTWEVCKERKWGENPMMMKEYERRKAILKDLKEKKD